MKLTEGHLLGRLTRRLEADWDIHEAEADATFQMGRGMWAILLQRGRPSHAGCPRPLV